MAIARSGRVAEMQGAGSLIQQDSSKQPFGGGECRGNRRHYMSPTEVWFSFDAVKMRRSISLYRMEASISGP